MKIKNLKAKVEAVLKEMPQTRNSDIELTIQLWRRYYPSRIIHRDRDNLDYVALDSLFDLPREDNVKRVRAKIQNEEHKYLPTSMKVAKQRKINMDIWYQAMAFNNYE